MKNNMKTIKNKKLYKTQVTTYFETVVYCDKTDVQKAVIESMKYGCDFEPEQASKKTDTKLIGEIKSAKDLPKGWDTNCLPWRHDENDEEKEIYQLLPKKIKLNVKNKTQIIDQSTQDKLNELLSSFEGKEISITIK